MQKQTKPPYSRQPVVAAYNPDAPRAGPGVYTLADIKDRCRVDKITGCWHWSMAMRTGGHKGKGLTPSVSIPVGVLGPQRRTLSVGRVVWLMAGRPLTALQVVWRTCTSDDCCAPDHLLAGTKSEEGAWMRKSGRRRCNPLRATTNARNCSVQAVPEEKVHLAVEMLLAGRLQREIAVEMGIHKATISKIATGKHYHQRPKGARGSSVFHQLAGCSV